MVHFSAQWWVDVYKLCGTIKFYSIDLEKLIADRQACMHPKCHWAENDNKNVEELCIITWKFKCDQIKV